MTLPKTLTDREYQKFTNTAEGPAVRTTTKVQVENVNLSAEMKVDSGHDLYLAENVERVDDLEIKFDEISGLTLLEIQAVENKTKGWVYNTKGADITEDAGPPVKTHIELDATAQSEGYPDIEAGDIIEVVYRGNSRFDDKAKDVTLTNKSQMTKLTDGVNEVDVVVMNEELGTGKKGLPSLGVCYADDATPPNYDNGKVAPLLLDSQGRISLASDIQIGAVEIKDADNNDRAKVIPNSADSVANDDFNGINVTARLSGYNGTTWDRITSTSGKLDVNLETGKNKSPTHTNVEVAATSTPILTQNNDRKGALFINDSDEVIYLMLGADAQMNKGIRLNSDGGSYEMSQELGNNVTSAVNAICSSGAKNLLIISLE